VSAERRIFSLQLAALYRDAATTAHLIRGTKRTMMPGVIVRIFPVLLLIIGITPCIFAQPSQLETDFRNPPVSARPRTLWMWMNGNVTADGITRDLEAMRRVGLGGALIFNVGEYIPKGPVDYGKESWRELVLHAAREADRLGLEL